MKLENILWLTDFSQDSRHALTYARTLAELFQTKLSLMHVIVNADSKIYGRVEGDYLAMEKNAREQSQAFLNEYVQEELADFPSHEEIVCQGNILEEVLSTVTRKKIGTIVLATHGRTGLSHLLLDSVTEKVIRSVSCPVYVVRHPDRSALQSGVQASQG